MYLYRLWPCEHISAISFALTPIETEIFRILKNRKSIFETHFSTDTEQIIHKILSFSLHSIRFHREEYKDADFAKNQNSHLILDKLRKPSLNESGTTKPAKSD